VPEREDALGGLEEAQGAAERDAEAPERGGGRAGVGVAACGFVFNKARLKPGRGKRDPRGYLSSSLPSPPTTVAPPTSVSLSLSNFVGSLAVPMASGCWSALGGSRLNIMRPTLPKPGGHHSLGVGRRRSRSATSVRTRWTRAANASRVSQKTKQMKSDLCAVVSPLS
jgi:hypothetical protein